MGVRRGCRRGGGLVVVGDDSEWSWEDLTGKAREAMKE